MPEPGASTHAQAESHRGATEVACKSAARYDAAAMPDDADEFESTLPMHRADEQGEAPAPNRFTLQRLSSAFARLMGATSLKSVATGPPQVALDPDETLPDFTDDARPVTPRTIVEGMLFVGAADGRPLTAREMAACIRDVEPEEVDAAVTELNDAYRQDGAAYEIVVDGAGYRLQLCPQWQPCSQRLRSRSREAKLSPSALEVLSVVAYRQPVTSDDVNRLRRSRCQALLAQLVRRQLVRIERPAASGAPPQYYTTDRFNRLFGVASAAELPRSEELDDS